MTMGFLFAVAGSWIVWSRLWSPICPRCPALSCWRRSIICVYWATSPLHSWSPSCRAEHWRSLNPQVRQTNSFIFYSPHTWIFWSSFIWFFFSSDPIYLANQEWMFQTVNLCLRIEHPVLPQPLTVPPTAMGAPVLDSGAVIPELSQCLQSVMEDQANTTLQERVLLLGFYFIGKHCLEYFFICLFYRLHLPPLAKITEVFRLWLVDGVITKPLPSETDSGGAESRQR